MIQFNLLPDVKLAYIKARRAKHLTVLVATVVGGASFGIFVLLFMAVNVLQTEHVKNLTKDISRDNTALRQKTDIEKVLTIQNQLKSLPELHNKKPVTSRLFDYLVQLTPNNVNLTNVTLDMGEGTLMLNGEAATIADVNKYVDTFKFTTRKAKADKDSTEDEAKAFSEVVLTNFGKDDKRASFQLTMKFDSTIFDNSKIVTLNVPSQLITTRSQTEKPNDLFQQVNEPDQQGRDQTQNQRTGQ